ncbi:PTS sugar transporter subunit IIB [Enorma burkinafasonensis]|uniref:PTS sugar transporter subunit IIB n=1 Tax=Enorma burkinafasonensis TaxID=2590867 RepID=UPI00119D8D7D|nr:PTS sugar transporter subunit IIB [Enorma burkinafasonensis]
MILNTRVDHRLLHGQVAFSWTTQLGADCILIANDDVMQNPTRKSVIKLAKPAGVKLVIKSIEGAIEAINSGVTDKYRLFVVVESIGDAHALATSCDRIKAINLGGTKPRDNTRNIAKAIYVTPEEEDQLRDLFDRGVEVEIRMVPVDPSVDARTVLQ